VPRGRGFKQGDIVVLSPDAEVYDSATGEPLPREVVADGELWNVDYYDEQTGMLNINRVLRPYPGAYCSWVHERYVKKVL